MPKLPTTKRKNSSLKGQSLEKLQQAQSVMAQLGYDPIQAMVMMAQDVNVDERVRAGLHKELAGFHAPKYRPVGEDDGQGQGGVHIHVKKFVVNQAPANPLDNVVEGKVLDGD